jgi:signal transduction histidine kinase
LTDKGIEKNIRIAQAAGVDFSSLQDYLEQRQILKHLVLVHQSGVRAARIVTNMLSFSRKNEKAAPKTLCRIPDLLDATLELALNDYDLKKLCKFKQTHVQKNYAPETPAVPCEHNKLQQVFFNLLKNAAQAMADFEGETSPELTISVYPSGNFVIVEIGDNGPGMAPDIQKRVFEPFFTTKPAGKGTGLGLSVSYFIIVKNHDGQMFVKSNPGQGTVFIIKLPVRTINET